MGFAGPSDSVEQICKRYCLRCNVDTRKFKPKIDDILVNIIVFPFKVIDSIICFLIPEKAKQKKEFEESIKRHQEESDARRAEFEKLPPEEQRRVVEENSRKIREEVEAARTSYENMSQEERNAQTTFNGVRRIDR